MKKTILPLTVLSATTVLLNGCCSPLDRTKEILKEDQSKIVLTINKDFSTTMINANTGERIPPCQTNIEKGTPLEELKREIRKCLPQDHQLAEQPLTSGELMMWEGTYCYAGRDGDGDLYVYCQPPLDLGFPR
jgi:hypothetical protein